FIPLKPSPIVSTSWLVDARIMKLAGNSLSFFSFIWFEEIRIEPSFAIKYSHVERKKEAFPDFVNSRLNLSNLLLRFGSKQQLVVSYQSFSSKILSKASHTSLSLSQ